MNGISLILLLACVIWMVQSHIILPENHNKSNTENIAQFAEILPQISIVDLKKSFRRVSRMDAERMKLSMKKVIPKKKARTPPPPNCVPLKSSCKPPAPPCCEPCAFCRCHLFQTVCYYKMGYPHC
ncbi:agouti-signaling protein-like [Pseudophryne corroboree]|uniref:agouti-signaling protein-like n=1 Tax=Pseudophryne corroboree TaxID=495146 RepID=UPI0030819297